MAPVTQAQPRDLNAILEEDDVYDELREKQIDELCDDPKLIPFLKDFDLKKDFVNY